MEFGVSVLLRPEIERDGCEFVDEGVGEAVFCEVDRLDVRLTGVAALDTDVRELLGCIHRKLSVVFLTASRADDAAELPFGEAETAEQAAAGAVALLAEDTERRFAIAEGAQWMRVALKLKGSTGADEFSVRLQEREREEFVRIGRRLAGGRPAGIQQIRPGTRGRVTQIVSDLGEASRAVLLRHGKKCRKAGKEFRQIQRSGKKHGCGASILRSRERAGRPVLFWYDRRRDGGATVFQPLVETFLDAGRVNVETEDLSGEGMLTSEVLSAPDPLLPGSVGHRAIMGLRAVASKCKYLVPST
jgi:hypothetical protein